ncbi:hypothetical protein B0H67DRAFT_567609, partial [Lasiosphaeris hirsuta]
MFADFQTAQPRQIPHLPTAQLVPAPGAKVVSISGPFRVPTHAPPRHPHGTHHLPPPWSYAHKSWL